VRTTRMNVGGYGGEGKKRTRMSGRGYGGAERGWEKIIK